MNIPGVSSLPSTLFPDDYNETFWKIRNFEQTDPEYLFSQLVDPIPSFAPYFLHSGRTVSTMFNKLATNYYTKSSTSNFALVNYETALQKLFDLNDWTPSKFVSNITTTRNLVRESFAILNERRTKCLQNEPLASCSKKAVIWQNEIDNANLLYLANRNTLIGLQSQILALQMKSVTNIMAQAVQVYLSNMRRPVGAKQFLEDYFEVNYAPTNFWCWFEATGKCSDESTSFSDMSISIRTATTVNSNLYTRAAFKTTSEYKNPLFSIKGFTSKTLSTQQFYDATSTGATITFSFKIAQVGVSRDWLQTSIFDTYPLGILNTTAGAWSNEYSGVFPWYISKLIVVKDVVITKDRAWSTNLVNSLQLLSSNPKLSGQFGPFLLSGEKNKYNGFSGGFAFSSTARQLRIKGPQIIGAVVSKLPFFPNYANATEN